MKLILKILYFTFLVGCNPINKSNIPSIKGFKHSSFEVKIEQDFAPNIQRTQLLETDSGEYLAIMNKAIPSIVLFNINQNTPKLTIPLFKEGPNRIGVDNGFHIVSKDCLLLATIPPKILVLNFNGEIKKSIPINDPTNMVNYLSSTNETPFLVSESSIYGAQPFFQNIYRVKDSDITETKHIYKISHGIGDQFETEWLNVFRPKDVWKEGKKSMDFTWAQNGDSIIVSPHTDHRLWVISKKTNSILSYTEVKSSNVNSFRVIEGYPVGDQGINETLENDQYDLFLHDHFRKVFYRFFFLGFDPQEFSQITPRTLFANRPKMGVMILDQNLNILGEHLFENFQIEPWNYFVGKEGLYVSTNNPNRDDFDENYLRYDIIRFEGLDYEN